MRTKFHILVAEPSDIIREGIVALLDDDFVVMSPCREYSASLAQRIVRQQPDVLLLNPTMLPEPAAEALATLQQAKPNMVVVALVYQYVEARLLGEFKTTLDIREKGSRVSALLRACCTALEAEGEDGYELSEREREVLQLVAKGYSSKEIADKLNISIHTVNTHRKNITHKTGIKSVAGLAVYAMLHDL